MESEALVAVKERNVSRIRELGKALYNSDELHHDDETETKITPLHLAVRLEYADIVEVLLEVGTRLDVPSSCGKLPIEELKFVTEESDMICLLLLGETKPSTQYRPFVLYELLLRAITKLLPRSVQSLIESGAPVLESSRLIGHTRSYITTPLLMWAGMELHDDEAALARHTAIGDILLESHEPFSKPISEALRRAISVGNRVAAESIVSHGVNLVKDSKMSLFERDALTSAVNGHYSVQRRDEFVLLVLNSGYRVSEKIQDDWIKNALPSLLVSRGMTCRTARLIFSVLGRLCRKKELWEEAIYKAETEGDEVDLHADILNGLLRLQELDSLCLVNLCRDAIRSSIASNTAEFVQAISFGHPPSVRRFLLLEDIFPGP